jgi:hypothetical protein
MRLIRYYFITSIIALSTVAPLAGCGGGGGGGGGGDDSLPIVNPSDAEYLNGVFYINVGASWIPSPKGSYYTEGLVSVDLAKINAKTGDVLEVQSSGYFYYTELKEISYGAAGLFVDASGKPLAPASGSTVSTYSSLTECGQAVPPPDPVPEDFEIKVQADTLVVPAGATAMRLSVSDCYFPDNDENTPDPIRVSITRK